VQLIQAVPCDPNSQVSAFFTTRVVNFIACGPHFADLECDQHLQCSMEPTSPSRRARGPERGAAPARACAGHAARTLALLQPAGHQLSGM
jgi:hypothetical protein